jgi:UDP-N-acetylmuramoyl-L-alanyl-D-glutamate--2,6-diaminopimelate ligase
VAAGLSAAPPVPGRFEPVQAGQPFAVIVDYAHTPDGLAEALRAARAAASGRVLVVFGCGGDRDATKRPAMGTTAAELADVAVVTSDNPRSEDPAAIISAVLSGIPASASSRVRVEPDRRAAIELALAEAEPGDVVLIAGKGHETTQTIGDQTLPFDDRDVARDLLTAGHQ